MRRLAAASILAVLALAGCGGTHTETVTVPKLATPQQVQKTTGHKCDPVNQTMGCVLATQPEPPLRFALPPGQLYGIDFAWSGVSAGTAKGLGAKFAASYLSDSSKDWTRGALDAYHAQGLATVAVRETSGTRALQGCQAGHDDAINAVRELAALAAPAGQPFTLAIDFDASGPDVASYFHCASEAEPGRVNAYGGYRPLLYLHQHGDVGNLNWQTYAWSGGLWLPASIAPLEQYLNGSSFDNDRAIAANYGQWGGPAVVVRVNHHYSRYPTTRRKLCHGCSERGVVRRYDRLRAMQRPNHHPHRSELRTLRHDAGLLADRIDNVARHGKHGYRVFDRVRRRDGLRARERGGVVPRARKHR